MIQNVHLNLLRNSILFKPLSRGNSFIESFHCAPNTKRLWVKLGEISRWSRNDPCLYCFLSKVKIIKISNAMQ